MRLVAAGHIVIDERLADGLLALRGPARARSRARDVVLTERKIQVLLLASAGRSDEEIAESGWGWPSIRYAATSR